MSSRDAGLLLLVSKSSLISFLIAIVVMMHIFVSPKPPARRWLNLFIPPKNEWTYMSPHLCYEGLASRHICTLDLNLSLCYQLWKQRIKELTKNITWKGRNSPLHSASITATESSSLPVPNPLHRVLASVGESHWCCSLPVGHHWW